MTAESTPHTGPDRRLSDVIAGYLDTVERGGHSDRQALLAAHPDLAEQLRAFFTDHDVMARVKLPVTPADAPTLGVEELSAGLSPGRGRRFGDYELLEEIARGGM